MALRMEAVAAAQSLLRALLLSEVPVHYVAATLSAKTPREQEALLS
jgi:hypothetical protein